MKRLFSFAQPIWKDSPCDHHCLIYAKVFHTHMYIDIDNQSCLPLRVVVSEGFHKFHTMSHTGMNAIDIIVSA